MAKKTQGTDLFAIHPDTLELINVGCITSIDGIDTSIDQIETTCLQDTARQYEAGLATPGAASFGINVDPEDATHVLLHQIKQQGKTLQWAVGWAEDPNAIPTVDTAGDFVLPNTRSWLVFSGYMSSFPFTFTQNAVVTSTIGIQVSGEITMIPKV